MSKWVNGSIPKLDTYKKNEKNIKTDQFSSYTYYFVLYD